MPPRIIPQPGEIVYTRFRFSGTPYSKPNRPCLILNSIDKTNFISLFVIPITHSEPKDPAAAVAVPPSTRQYLRLSRNRCWFILSEVNEIFWPSDAFLDMDVAPGTARPWTRGSVSPQLFCQVQEGLAALHRR